MSTNATSTKEAGQARPFGQRVREWWNSKSRGEQWLWCLIIIGLVYLLPFFDGFGILATQGTDYQLALFEVARYALIAIGLNIVVGQAGMLDLGYVAFYAIGAYVAGIMTSPDSFLTTKYPWLIVVPVAMAITMLSGVIIGGPTLRLRGDYLAIVTLGFGEIVRLLADNLGPLRGNRGFTGIAGPPGEIDGEPIFKQTDGLPWYWLTVTIVILMLILVGNLERSRVGRSWVAIREDEDAAELMGVPTFRFKIWAFVMGAALGGLSGVLFVGQIGYVNNQRFDVLTSVLFLCAVVLGGSGNKVGVLLGAVVIAYIPLRFIDIAEYRFLIFGLALVILMIFRPQGLLGARQRLLARGRWAYEKLIGRPEQIGTESALTEHREGGETK